MNRQNREFATTLGTDLIEGRAALIDVWLTELGARGRLRPQSSLPVEQLRELMLPVVEWLGLHVRADDPDGVEVDSLRTLARSRRSQSYKISEVLDELDLLDRLLFDRARAVAAGRRVPPSSGEVLEAAERLQEGTSRIRTILVGTFEEDADRHARELSSHLESFVRTLSHEIKNPLGAALSGTELLRDAEVRRDDARFAQFTELVSRNIRRAEALIADLRALLIPDTEQDGRGAVPLRAIISDVRKEVHTAAGDKTVEVRVDRDAVPAVELDGARVTLVLMNLVWNAINYSDPAKPNRWVRIGAERGEDGGLCLTVHDNGLGIPHDAQERIFERFFRAHPEVQGGTGLGLSIVADAVAQLRGTIRLESEPGQGTTFFVTLPPPEAATDSGTPAA